MSYIVNTTTVSMLVVAKLNEMKHDMSLELKS